MSTARRILAAAALLWGLAACGGGGGGGGVPLPFTPDAPGRDVNVLALDYDPSTSTDTRIVMDLVLNKPEVSLDFAGEAVSISADLAVTGGNLTFSGFSVDSARVADAVVTPDPLDPQRLIVALAGVSPGHLGTLMFDAAGSPATATFGLESAVFLNPGGVILPDRVIDARGGRLYVAN